MGKIKLSYHSLPDAKCPDIIVVGGGTSGVAAALAASKRGKKVYLIESFTALGGTQTMALTTPMMSNHTKGDRLTGEWLNKGIHQEILEEYKRCFGPVPKIAEGFYDVEILKIVYDRMLEASGVEVWLGTNLIAPIMEENRLIKIIVHNCSGLIALGAKIFIDATGDAQLAFEAGVPCETSNIAQGEGQAVSLRFTLANVDLKRAFQFASEKIEAGILTGRIEPPTPVVSNVYAVLDDERFDPEYGCNQFYVIPGREGEVNFNCPELRGYDSLSGKGRSDLTLKLRRQIFELYRLLQKKFPGFERSYIASIAPFLGIRESRRIKGAYTLTEEDVVGGEFFEDGIARNRYPIDIHNPKMSKELINVLGRDRPPEGSYNEIPYRCLYSNYGPDNLLVTGRAISSTFGAQSAIRIQNNCIALGEAAGLAAATALDEGLSVRKIDGKSLKKQLFK